MSLEYEAAKLLVRDALAKLENATFVGDHFDGWRIGDDLKSGALLKHKVEDYYSRIRGAINYYDNCVEHLKECKP